MGNAAQELSGALAQLVEKIGPSVVRVEDGRDRPSTGVVWDGPAGLIATASHSQENEDSLEVGLHDGSTVKASLVGFDNTTDTAVIKVDQALPALTWSDGADLKVGNLVLLLGRPGKTVRASVGIISAAGKDEWRTASGGKIDRYVQADVSRYPGFSGGPLVDMNGNVLGMYTSVLARGASAILPTPTLKRVIPSLQQHGKVQRGFIGVGVYPVQLPDAVSKQVGGQSHGVVVVALQPGGPAEAAGLALGDVLIQLDGKAVQSPSELISLLDPDKVGKPVTAKVSRTGTVRDVPITVAARS
ncbi:MAG TPA: trypsin-like peptidase domain-containing protein [Myxococcales bacterium]|nr:trypsin-like peptidase domain-containing protein [Myxococcales bacterium]